jgi:hypothetical protein
MPKYPILYLNPDRAPTTYTILPVEPIIVKDYNDYDDAYAKPRDFAIEMNDGTILLDCQICGEPADEEMGEFWDHNSNDSVIAHGQCGLDAGFEMA